MGKGYAEGPRGGGALRGARARRADRPRAEEIDRPAVFASTPEDETKHFIGWLDDVDPDALFASGKAWGISVVRRRDD
jgi:hypothetical protein